MTENLASKLCALLADDTDNPVTDAREWRLLGQEQDGTLVLTWISENRSHLGFYTEKTLTKIYSFEETRNVIQASINLEKSMFGYVTKSNSDDGDWIYEPFLGTLQEKTPIICSLNLERAKQIMVQFLYRKLSILNEKQPEMCLVFIHQECVLLYKLNPENFGVDNFNHEIIVRAFVWAQWDPINQTLYYIHYRKPNKCLVEGDEAEVKVDDKTTPTLSALQFHNDLPHETVLNIPLNLPHVSNLSSSCGIYEDDTVPLRIHDCSLDLMVLAHVKGYVCVCHNYLYQPVQPSEVLEPDSETLVHFAYSVTVLHHSCVLHCVVPGIPWNKAKTFRPFFSLYDDHILILIPGVCTHLLDVGSIHEPCCHVTLPFDPIFGDCQEISLAPLYSFGKNSVVNLPTLDVLNVGISISRLTQAFKSDTALENKQSIIHYLLLHLGEIDVALQLISSLVDKPPSLSFTNILKEFLVGSTYSTVLRNMPKDAYQLVSLLPLTTMSIGGDIEVKVGDYQVCLSQDVLWNASMMVLSPQQRIVPYRADIWVKLWEHLAKVTKAKPKFKANQVVEKLMVSLNCYQPEALSRSSTPLSPCGTVSTSTIVNDLTSSLGPCNRKSLSESLPFYEIESCTASKQEHIISVNLREISMHLLKQSTENKVNVFNWQSQTPMHVHAVATRYVTAQLEQTRCLCQVLCKAVTANLPYEQEKGFLFVDELPDDKRIHLFTVLQRYFLAAECIAFPLPQGFTSFFTFLGYRIMSFDMFLQYVRRSVFELQVDVMKVIMADLEDTKVGVERKLQLLSLLPRTRAKRILNQWYHPTSLMLRAREHAINILSGVENSNPRSQRQRYHKNKQHKLSLAAFPTADRLSPLDTFLDLLTAKANLTELDFGLLIEATVFSNDENNF